MNLFVLINYSQRKNCGPQQFVTIVITDSHTILLLHH